MTAINTRTKQARQAIHFACCAIFVAFSFLYLALFQSDVLATVQHIMSAGRTNYHVFLFSSIITLILVIPPFVLARYLHFPSRTLALVWLPSFFLLGWLTDVALSAIDPASSAVGTLPFICVGLLYIISLYIAPRIGEPQEPNTPLYNLLWPNIMILVVGIAFATYAGNTNRTIHYELRLERLLGEGKYNKVLEITSKDTNPSRSNTAIQAYALSMQQKLGDELFRYPCLLGGSSLLADPSDTLGPSNLPTLLKEHLGGYPVHDMDGTHYLQYLSADTLATPAVRDYLLSALLLDMNLPTFADSLISFYVPKDTLVDESVTESKRNNKKNSKTKDPLIIKTLPRHFAEALLLYSRLTEQPVAVLDDESILQNYKDFLELYMNESDPEKREEQCRKLYGDTYWAFYYFNKK